LEEIFEFRANYHLQKTGLELSSILTQGKTHPIDAWNDVQVFYLQKLAVAYGDLVLVKEFHN
jgi:hypothetical protein